MYAPLLLLLPSLLNAACGQEPEATDPAQGVYRIDVALSPDSLTLQGVEFVDGMEAPEPLLGGDYMVVVRGENGVSQVWPVAVPRSMIAEDYESPPTEIAVQEGTAAIFVDARESITAIELMVPGGDVVATIEPDELVEVATAPSFRSAIEDRYPHIEVLGPGDEARLPGPIIAEGFGAELVEIQGIGEADIVEGLEALTPRVRNSVRYIAESEFAGEQLKAVTLGSTVVFNSAEETSGVYIYAAGHEAMHAYNHGLDWTAADGELEVWPEDVRAQLSEVVLEQRLDQGLTQLWAQLHDTGVGEGLAAPYMNDIDAWTPDQAEAGGFSSPYGATQPREDIAEYVATVLYPGESTTMGRGPCSQFNGASELTPELGIPYTKLVLLNALGALSDGDFNSCTGSIAVTGGDGIHWGDTISFTGALQAGWLDVDGYNFFALAGDGPNTYRTLVQVYAPEQAALGLHRLDNIGYGLINAPVNGAFLANDDPFLARTSGSGLMVVSSITGSHSEGFFLMLTLRNAASAVTDVIPIGTFRIPI